MKKWVCAAVAASVVSIAGGAHAESTGCGLGTMIFEGQRGLFPQILAVTTNGTSGNQTFGITSGTLGCTRDGVVSASAKVAMFTGANMERLAGDMSRGEGESLEALASLIGVGNQDRGHFYQVVQSRFNDIFSGPDATAKDVVASLNDVMAEDDVLQAYVMA